MPALKSEITEDGDDVTITLTVDCSDIDRLRRHLARHVQALSLATVIPDTAAVILAAVGTPAENN